MGNKFVFTSPFKRKHNYAPCVRALQFTANAICAWMRAMVLLFYDRAPRCMACAAERLSQALFEPTTSISRPPSVAPRGDCSTHQFDHTIQLCCVYYMLRSPYVFRQLLSFCFMPFLPESPQQLFTQHTHIRMRARTKRMRLIGFVRHQRSNAHTINNMPAEWFADRVESQMSHNAIEIIKYCTTRRLHGY